MMELVKEDLGYKDLAQKAKELDIPYVGVKKDVLLTQVNEKIEKINSGEIEAPEVSEVAAPVVNETQTEETSEQDGTNESTETPKVTAPRKPREKKERPVRVKAKKWFEEEGAFPYQAGDVVEIVSGKDLIGRKLQVIEPSAKKDMVKGRLVHPVTGGLQGTVIAIAFDRIQLLESAASIAEQEPTEVNDNQDGVNEEVTNEAQDQEQTEVSEVLETEESIIAGSEEVVDIPEQEEVQDQEENKAE